MSDFFDHLLNNGQSPASSLAPLPVSINEPAHAPGDSLWETVDLESEPAPPSPGFAVPFARPTAPREPAPNIAASEQNDDLRSRLEQLQSWLGSMSSRQEAPSQQAQLHDRSFDPQPGEHPAVPEATHLRAASSSQPMPPQPPEQAIRSPALIPKTQQITREVIVRQAAPIEEHRARPEHDVPIAEFPSRQDKPVVQQAAMAPPKALFEIKETVRLEPRPAAYPALPDFAAQPGRLAAPPTPRPVIHVTIGRIEVRAARQTAAPQPAERRSPSAAMSLDEYLRRRSEGGR